MVDLRTLYRDVGITFALVQRSLSQVEMHSINAEDGGVKVVRQAPRRLVHVSIVESVL